MIIKDPIVSHFFRKQKSFDNLAWPGSQVPLTAFSREKSKRGKKREKRRVHIHTWTRRKGRNKRVVLYYTRKRLIFVPLTLSPFRFRSRFSIVLDATSFVGSKKKRYFLHTRRRFNAVFDPSLVCILFVIRKCNVETQLFKRRRKRTKEN